MAELKAENESLKAEIEASKSSATEENRVEEISNSSIQSAIPISETDSDVDDGPTQNHQPPLAICDGNIDDIEQDKPRSTRPANKRARHCDNDATLVAKKSKSLTYCLITVIISIYSTRESRMISSWLN